MLALISGLVFALVACSRDRHDHPELKTGAALYNHHCAECHGEAGTGRLADQTPASILTRRDRDGIIEYITQPVNPQRKMPVFSAMPYREATAIANHLLALQRAYAGTRPERRKPLQLMIEP